MSTGEETGPLPGPEHDGRWLFDRVYDELRRLAARKMRREKPGQTLTPTGLVHEAYLRLSGPAGQGHWDNQAHFIAAAAEAMRRILVEQARRKSRLKHGGQFNRVNDITEELPTAIPDERILAVDQALDGLKHVMPEMVELVKMRFFLAMTNEEIATVLDLSESTIKRRWRLARAWLAKHLSEDVNAAGDTNPKVPE